MSRVHCFVTAEDAPVRFVTDPVNRPGAILMFRAGIEAARLMMGIIGFVFYSIVALAPVLGAAFIVSRFRRRDRLTGLAPLAVVIGFVAGGAIGWGTVPDEWTASFSTTIEAAGNAAKYGALFEHAAERALLYFFYFALFGEIVFALAALLFLRWIPIPSPAETLP